MTFSFLVGPIVGGIIGYITNGIAIKMLFRPLKPIYIGKWKLPFTPGIIPKERERIAKTIAVVVGKELINEETLTKHLLSQEIYAKLEGAIERSFAKKRQSTHTVEEELLKFATPETIEEITTISKDKLQEVIYEKVVGLEVGNYFAESACDAIKGSLGSLAMFINDSLVSTVKSKLEVIINEMVAEQADQWIAQMLEEESEKLLQKPINSIVEPMTAYLPKLKYAVMNQYTHLVKSQLPTILKTIDIPKIVEERIMSLELLELEKLILGIVQKELNAIIWLGALLGAVLGIFMSIF